MGKRHDPPNKDSASRPRKKASPDRRAAQPKGEPILNRTLATNDLLAASEFDRHPLVADRYFYTLPRDLWTSLLAELKEDRFDPGELRMEQLLATCCGDHASRVGIWRGQYVNYMGLRPMPTIGFSDDDYRAIGMNPLEARQAVRLFTERDAKPAERFRRGYAGWLLTNPQFLDEHDALLSQNAPTVRQWGTHRAGIVLPAGILLTGADPSNDPGWRAFNEACEQFFARWRLQSLAGPYLPVPLQALMAGTFPWTVVQPLMRGGVFFLPDTMPIPSRDQLRGMLDDALHRGEQPDHLREWLKIIRASSGAKSTRPVWAPFEIQHYLRLLRQRHAGAIARKMQYVKRALCRFFKKSSTAVQSDLIEIRQRSARIGLIGLGRFNDDGGPCWAIEASVNEYTTSTFARLPRVGDDRIADPFGWRLPAARPRARSAAGRDARAGRRALAARPAATRPAGRFRGSVPPGGPPPPVTAWRLAHRPTRSLSPRRAAHQESTARPQYVLHRSFPRKWANNRASSRCKALRSRTSRTSAIVMTSRASELLASTTTAFKGQSPSARLGEVAAAAMDAAAHEESRLRHMDARTARET